MPAVRFPFSALVGQDDLRRALLINAVAPDVGGVLVRGERGTAKTTAVRALEALLPPVDGRPAPLVELPVGATVDRVVGTLDLERALQGGEAVLQPGLMARAHRGILYVDEVNLLGDHLVDVLLDAAAQGEAVVERDGVSARHPARFVLVGTMNPEEGDLRPQLLDRFGLSVTVAGSTDPAVRAEVVRRRLAFEADPAAFAARHREQEEATALRIAAAAERLPGVVLGDRMLRLITGACARLGVDGMRADLVAARCSRAIAALEGRDDVEEQDVHEAMLLTLPHRRRRGPLDPPGLEPEELDDALRQARDDDPGEPDPDDGPDGDGGPDGGSDGGPGDGAGSDGPGAAAAGGPPPGGPDGPGRGDAPSSDGGGAPGREPQDAGDDATSGAADGSDGAARDGAQDPDGDAPGTDPAGRQQAAPPTGRDRPFSPGAAAGERTDAPAGGGSGAGVGSLLHLSGRGRGGVAGRRGRTSGEHGQAVDVRPREHDTDDLAIAATLRAAALRGATRSPGADRPRTLDVRPEDHRTPVRAGREGTLVVFCVDASGSMGARRRMAAVKAAALGLLMDAYQRRDRVALIAFRGREAEVVLPPTGSVERAADRLARLATGGGTPLAAGLDAASTLIAAHRLRDPERRSLCVVVTDGRASGGKVGLAAAVRAATRLGRTADGVVLFDSEQGRVRLGLGRVVADAAGARLLPVDVLTGGATTPGRVAA
ncbi:VWA domain-containing protein [Patulibacter sp.]|uniref:VWA domain-containing protein n=1 Tax=Patulibacter sp. TaxID=1912859 RepID=UPI002718E760|nr:VWA domain-containing protein [Patulibacter sp.]MDO9409782.1 VWA domain-containing protein [Patulibacter sp.]